MSSSWHAQRSATRPDPTAAVGRAGLGIVGRPACSRKNPPTETRGRPTGRICHGWGTTLVVEAREPCRDVEQRRPATRPVPVHEDDPALDQAEVVAAHIAVEQGDSLELGGVRRHEQSVAPRVQPRGIEETERQRTRRVGQQREPARPDVEELAEQSNDRLGRGRGLDRLERREHGVDASRRPRGRPHRPREVLQNERGRLAVVVPSEATRQEVAARQGRVVRHVRAGATPRCSRRRRSWRRRRNRPRSPRATCGSTAPRAREPAPSRPAASRSRRGYGFGRHRRASRNLRTPSRSLI
jgi:hypothetical protein